MQKNKELLMRYITKQEANHIIYDICQSHKVNNVLYDENDYYRSAEQAGDVAAYNIYIKRDFDNQTETLLFSGRIRVMPNYMTSDELLLYADKCKNVALCIQELNSTFQNICVNIKE